MTKLEIIGQIFNVLHQLEAFDSQYAPEPTQVYMRCNKIVLSGFLAQMEVKLKTAQMAKECGSTILQCRFRLRLPDTVQEFIYENKVCQNIGIGHTPVRLATKSDYKKYPVII